ncbi:MAG: subclass B3 metallo-beta-lactamase [Acidobacteria bacterium]|nr:subclass B3 metallo-beta-lactamase [Acidobacteriota bacterium]MBK9528222.1 subclass B3 metallo-beta-lactamase [Acidobacteriota bacterium]
MRLFLVVLLLFLFAINGSGQMTEQDREWNKPVEPFCIIGNVYYVGASEVTSFLITTSKGHILIDSGYAETVPQIKQNLDKLGFKLSDVKYLLNTQAHYDHAAGLAELKRLTKAKMVASVGDKRGLEEGDKNDFAWGDKYAFEPVKVDRTIADGGVVSLGGVTLKAVLTPGHTPGSTMWLLNVKENGRIYQVAFVSSTSIPGYTLLDNRKYPSIIPDYTSTFAKMKRVKPDVFLASHGSFFDILEKAEKFHRFPAVNPFIDAEGYTNYVERTHTAFLAQLKKEQDAKRAKTR